jgi:hypothetical protein
VIVKQVLGLSPEEPVTAMILEDFLTFMKGLISFPLRIPGTPYARAVQVINLNNFTFFLNFYIEISCRFVYIPCMKLLKLVQIV